MQRHIPKWFGNINLKTLSGDSISSIFKRYLAFHQVLPANTKCYFYQVKKGIRVKERWIVPKTVITYRGGYFIADDKKYKNFPVSKCEVIPIYD